jgi:hypothetical protein
MNKPVHIDELPFATPTQTPRRLEASLQKKPDNVADRAVAKKAAGPPSDAEPSDFDWDNDDSVVLREQRATAVYRNPVGEVVIRQKGCWPDEDTWIYISCGNEVAFMEGMAEQLKK